ncbi:hypothetical protein [Streptomyces anulatus]|uniref:hypothetical protein n=1 Tax=Streptomyces anulatus TaxID=1892 RepID=UPI0036C60162
MPRIQHVIITRIHRVSSRYFEHLFALRELTKIRPTLLYHGPLSPALAASLLHEAVHTLAAARRAAARQPVRVVGGGGQASCAWPASPGNDLHR